MSNPGVHSEAQGEGENPAASIPATSTGSLRGISKTIQDIVQHKEISKRIADDLRPIEPKLAHHDLSSVSRVCKSLYRAFAPFLFETVNLERIDSWEDAEMMAIFFDYSLKWRVETYEMVHHLVHSWELWHLPLPLFLDFALRLPNLKSLFLPYGKFAFIDGVAFDNWTKLEVLLCPLHNQQFDQAIALPSIKTLHLRLVDVERLAGSERYGAFTPAETFYLTGETTHLVSMHEADFEWNRFAPNTKSIVLVHEGPHAVEPTPDDVDPPFDLLRGISTIETLTVYVPTMNRHDDGSYHGSFFTPLGWTNDLELLAREVLDTLGENGGCPNLRTVQIAVQLVEYIGVEPEFIDNDQLDLGNPVGMAVELAQERDWEWQTHNFASWYTCAAQRGEGGEWDIVWNWKLMWKRDPNYPFVFDV